VDADAVRARAHEVAALADEVRALAAWVRRSADADWESVAAEAFRAELHAEIERVLAAAVAVDEGAAALVAHALAVEATASASAVVVGEAVGEAVGEVVGRLLPRFP
jgi:hypothetical protein